ncbi:MAG TPA: cysteine desulfuration protein SufE [Alphaproteobacteria bacterium]|nr:cysteine desulfuration protein SufE [Alphaproteobacteria bacterium]HAJ45053.1 cysteine desulfuration protein SufE [Alphaproteobacteria bacterium]
MPPNPGLEQARRDFGPRAAQIIEDFDLLDDWEDRYRYVIELARELTPLATEEKTEANKVRGCASQVWLSAHREKVEGGVRLTFSGDSDALIVKGLVAVLMRLYSGESPETIASRDAQALFARLGLGSHLSQQRSNGFFSMVARIQALARGA